MFCSFEQYEIDFVKLVYDDLCFVAFTRDLNLKQ